MGIGISSIQNLLELYDLGYLKEANSILEIGSQEVHVNYKDLIHISKIAGISENEIENIPNVKNWPFSPRGSSRFFYEILGIKEYTSIDINGEYNSIPHDLNEPFNDKSKFNKYDIVTDYGSCEHVFNVGECYKTLHNLLKPGGLMIIDQALLKGNGYFKFDETFIEGIATANSYKILYNSYVISTGSKTENGTWKQFHIPRNAELLNVLDFSKLKKISSQHNIGIYAVMQKIKDEEFKVPYEHSLISERLNVSGFNRVYFQNPLSYSNIPSATKKIEDASLTEIIKSLLNWLKKKSRKIIRKIVVSLK